VSGIKSRHVVGETEFAIDLAKQAITKCLATSKYGPGDIDLLICATIARCDGPSLWISYEPSTSLRLKEHFGFDKALVFDIASACSGMFTAINIVDALIKLRVIECGLVVSGEYISHLAETAQKEIEDFLDSRLACLTLGDAGAAVMLEAAPSVDVGFNAIDLCTLGSCARYCIARPTEQEHGGGIMFTDALKLTDAAAKHGSEHALRTMKRAGWSPDSFQHLIMHQTSSTALASAMREINRLLKGRVCHQGNTIDNLERRGNTASTTHFVALADNILNNRIRSGDRVIFAISGSGLTMGTALYTFDDLPDRMRGTPDAPGDRSIANSGKTRSPRLTGARRIRIESVGTVPRRCAAKSDSLVS
jgi:3-oxoacyl-[acyl-carrier-protein] synthase III